MVTCGGLYGLLQRVTGFQKHVLNLHCLKWSPFLSRLLCGMHHRKWVYCMYLLACLQWVVGLLSEEWLLPPELSSRHRAFAQQSFQRLPPYTQCTAYVDHRICFHWWTGLISGLLEYTSWMTCRQSCSGDCAALTGSSGAGFMTEVTWSPTLGLSKELLGAFPFSQKSANSSFSFQ